MAEAYIPPWRTVEVFPNFADAVAAAREQPCDWCGSRERAGFDATACGRCFAGRPEGSLLKNPEFYGYTLADRSAFDG